MLMHALKKGCCYLHVTLFSCIDVRNYMAVNKNQVWQD
jgi:hypothetical protein